MTLFLAALAAVATMTSIVRLVIALAGEANRGAGAVTDAPTEAELWAGGLLACGLNVVPIRPGTKAAAIEWRHLQNERQIGGDWDALDALMAGWWGRGSRYGLAVVTGPASGLVVVAANTREAVR